MPELVNDIEAARLLGCAPITLRMARSTRQGGYAALPFYRMGKKVRYSVADIEAFLSASRKVVKVEGTRS